MGRLITNQTYFEWYEFDVNVVRINFNIVDALMYIYLKFNECL